jgi:ketosteroid isomerase-like protein
MLRLPITLALFLSVPSLALAQSSENRAKDKAYIQQAESDWAESVVTNDVSVLDRLLAEDFVGVDIDGSHYSKADAVKDFRNHPSEFASNHLNEVEIRFYGDAAVAQGSESWKKKDGTPGKFVWTDTWVRRDGKWQIVAAEDLVPQLTSTAATPAASATRPSDLAAIEELHKADVEATLTQDPTMLTRLWSDDGINLGFPGEPVVGIKAMQEAYDKFWAGNNDFKVLKYVPAITEVQIVDGWALEIGTFAATYKMNATSEPVSVNDKGMRLLKRQRDGSWKFALVGLK